MQSKLNVNACHSRQVGVGTTRAAVSILLVIVFGALLFTLGRKLYFDNQVRELCEKDGGVRAFEIVHLPADQFNQWGLVSFYRPELGEEALGMEYQLKFEVVYYRRGNPELSREQYQVIRRADGKVLGKSVAYGRGGGDLPSPSHDSSFRCPTSKEGEPNTLLKAVFVRSAN